MCLCFTMLRQMETLNSEQAHWHPVSRIVMPMLFRILFYLSLVQLLPVYELLRVHNAAFCNAIYCTIFSLIFSPPFSVITVLTSLIISKHGLKFPWLNFDIEVALYIWISHTVLPVLSAGRKRHFYCLSPSEQLRFEIPYQPRSAYFSPCL